MWDSSLVCSQLLPTATLSVSAKEWPFKAVWFYSFSIAAPTSWTLSAWSEVPLKAEGLIRAPRSVFGSVCQKDNAGLKLISCRTSEWLLRRIRRWHWYKSHKETHFNLKNGRSPWSWMSCKLLPENTSNVLTVLLLPFFLLGFGAALPLLPTAKPTPVVRYWLLSQANTLAIAGQALNLNSTACNEPGNLQGISLS